MRPSESAENRRTKNASDALSSWLLKTGDTRPLASDTEKSVSPRIGIALSSQDRKLRGVPNGAHFSSMIAKVGRENKKKNHAPAISWGRLFSFSNQPQPTTNTFAEIGTIRNSAGRNRRSG